MRRKKLLVLDMAMKILVQRRKLRLLKFIYRSFCHDHKSSDGDVSLEIASKPMDRMSLWSKYDVAKSQVEETLEPNLMSPHGIFTNNELDLKEIAVYGFDYDYTLAVYKKELNTLIYELALERLIANFKYPAILSDLPYDPGFAIRGLHYDVRCGTLLKLDAYALIQNGTVYRGKTSMNVDQIRHLYGGNYVPFHYLPTPDDKDSARMIQSLDLFSLPEVGLLANIIQYFDDCNIDFDPESLFRDVRTVVQSVHLSGVMYDAVSSNLPKYIHYMHGLKEFFERLIAHKKIVFLISNSPFRSMNAGLTYLIGKDWRDYFHYIVIKARKPKFFKEMRRPFRVYNEDTDRLSYEKVNTLKRGIIYAEGNLRDFMVKTDVDGSGVLYFGDHVYSDLAEPMLTLGWRTGAIVPELKREIQIQRDPNYGRKSKWLSTLTYLIGNFEGRCVSCPESLEVIAAWKKEREKLRHDLKVMFNPQFGSIFRTYHAPTFFSRRMTRLADIYTSKVTNLLGVRLDHTFYPVRYALPHETHYAIPMADIEE